MERRQDLATKTPNGNVVQSSQVHLVVHDCTVCLQKSFSSSTSIVIHRHPSASSISVIIAIAISSSSSIVSGSLSLQHIRREGPTLVLYDARRLVRRSQSFRSGSDRSIDSWVCLEHSIHVVVSSVLQTERKQQKKSRKQQLTKTYQNHRF